MANDLVELQGRQTVNVKISPVLPRVAQSHGLKTPAVDLRFTVERARRACFPLCSAPAISNKRRQVHPERATKLCPQLFSGIVAMRKGKQ